VPIHYPCKAPYCGGLVEKPKTFCRDCMKKRGKDRRIAVAGTRDHLFYNSPEWRDLRLKHLRKNPACLGCVEKGERTFADVCDHIVPISIHWQRRLDPDNLQSLCHPCHNRKRQKESRMGESVLTHKRVVLVAGPPGAGKTTYVREQMKSGDLVFDFDAVSSALSFGESHHTHAYHIPYILEVKKSLLNMLMMDSKALTMWVIATMPCSVERARFRRYYNAEVVVLTTPASVCKNRIMSDTTRHESAVRLLVPVVDEWWRSYISGDNETVIPYG
jgi:5-methylcytosine-specific restriction protein A